jgi:hydroxymethylpyrimidine/phosphomethylpyrimidine kinase
VVVKNFRIGAIKTGLLCSAETVSAVANMLRRVHRRSGRQISLVIDPVIVATSGDPLLEPAAIDAYREELFPLGMLITPNLNEAETLLAMKIKDRGSMQRAGKQLEKQFGTAILLKGGHLAGNHAVDFLFNDGKVVEFSAPFVRGVQTHGTCCTYSAAIAAGLAYGISLEEAIGRAKKFVSRSIERHFSWTADPGKSLHALRHF